MNLITRFQDMRFGMFIHWGLYAIPAEDAGEWLMWNKHIPPEEYNRLAERFLPPENFTPESWVIAAKNAGMRYMVFTARHHDGFALHESKANPFNSMNAPCRRDFVREYVHACRKHGMGTGLYYSIINWQFPCSITGPEKSPENWEKMVQMTHAELRELMTDYGKIDLLWYDGCNGTGGMDAGLHHRTKELNAMVRSLQPEILINDRSDLPEDFATPEQSLHVPEAPRPWESCLTMNLHWGYCEKDHAFKTTETILRALLHCAAHNGNLLLNVGPRPDGTIPEESQERLAEVGRWMKFAGRSVYGSCRTPVTEMEHAAGTVTETRDGRIYLHLFGRTGKTVRIDGIAELKRATLLNDGTALAVSPVGGAAWEISGFSPENEGEIPETVLLETAGPRGPFAENLLPPVVLHLEKGNTPILGVVMEQAAGVLPEGRILLPEQLGSTVFPDSVLYPGAGKKVIRNGTAAWTPEHSGNYTVKVGIIAARAGQLLEKNSKISWNVENPGLPDAITFPELSLHQGQLKKIELSADFPVEIYAVKLIPLWESVPVEKWEYAGAFPSEYTSWDAGNQIRDALNAEFRITKQTVTRLSDGLVRSWSRSAERKTEFDHCGIDFLCHAENAGHNVCFARLELDSETEQTVEAVVFCDWWAELELNGKKVLRTGEPAVPDAEFSTHFANLTAFRLKTGKNVLLVRNHCGIRGSNFRLFINRYAGRN